MAKILVVDDEPNIRRLFRDELAPGGHLLVLDVAGLEAGMYAVLMNAGEETVMRRVMIMK